MGTCFFTWKRLHCLNYFDAVVLFGLNTFLVEVLWQYSLSNLVDKCSFINSDLTYLLVCGQLNQRTPFQRSNSCVEAIPYIGSDRDRDRSKTPERSEKRNRTPDRPQHKNSGKTPENQRRDRAKTPDKRDRAKTPEKRDRAKTPEKRDRAKTPDRGRRSKSRTPDRSRKLSPDSYSGSLSKILLIICL